VSRAVYASSSSRLPWASERKLCERRNTSAVPEVQPLAIGSPAFAMPDNVAHQSGTGNWVIDEDADTTYKTPHNDEIWDCLPDGADEDQLSDGWVRVATRNDLTAEWSGGIFDATGTRYFVSIQHNVTGKGVVIEITGWCPGGDAQGQGPAGSYGNGHGNR